MTDRQGVEIDYCPQCRGIWLDRGELDRIIDKSSDMSWQPEQPSGGWPMYGEPGHYKPRHHDDHYCSNQYYDRHRKKGFLGELLDF
jgi:Zn-finger nucleic acid-binding protein